MNKVSEVAEACKSKLELSGMVICNVTVYEAEINEKRRDKDKTVNGVIVVGYGVINQSSERLKLKVSRFEIENANCKYSLYAEKEKQEMTIEVGEEVIVSANDLHEFIKMPENTLTLGGEEVGDKKLILGDSTARIEDGVIFGFFPSKCIDIGEEGKSYSVRDEFLEMFGDIKNHSIESEIEESLRKSESQ